MEANGNHQSTYSFVRPQRRVVADALVDGEANGESQSLLDGLAVLVLGAVDLGEGAVDDRLAEDAQVEDGGSGDALGDQAGEGEVADLGGLEVLGGDVRVGKIGDLLGLGGLDLLGLGLMGVGWGVGVSLKLR